MKISYETLLKFVQGHGRVDIADHKDALRVQNGELIGWDLAEKAERFRFEGRWYSRAEFEKLLDKRMNPKPSNARAIPMSEIEHVRTRFKAFAIKQNVSRGAVETRTFDTTAEAQAWLERQGAGSTGKIEEVDAEGKPIKK